MATVMGEKQLNLVVASTNGTKIERLENVFAGHTAIGLLGIRKLGLERQFNPIEKGLPFESDRAFAKAQEAFKLTGEASLGWDDGMYIQSQPFPGPDIKATVGQSPKPEEVFGYYRERFDSLPPEKRKGYIKRAICVVDEKGKPYMTAKQIPFTVSDRVAPVEGKNPLDSLIIPEGHDKPFSDFTDADRLQYDQRLMEAVEDIKTEKDRRDRGESTRRSMEMNGRVWVFSRRDMHLFNQEDERGVAQLAGVLNDNYGGLQEGWVAKKYGTASEHDELDPNGFFSKRRGLLLIGEPGEPTAMLSWVLKRGGSMKTNTLRVANEHQREGLGKTIKNEMLLMGEAVGVRKMYCTTSRQNDAALGLNLGLGYKVEAEFPGHYRLDKDEVILGKILRPDADTSDRTKSMLITPEQKGAVSVDVFDPQKDGEGFSSLIQTSLSGWHDDVGRDFIDNTMQGALRGVEDVNGKGKFILVAHDGDGKVIGSAVLTLKMGGPAKIYPLVGPKEAQDQLLQQVIARARELNSHVVYTFSPEWDKAESGLLEEIGFENRGLIESPYKPGANLIPWSMHI